MIGPTRRYGEIAELSDIARRLRDAGLTLEADAVNVAAEMLRRREAAEHEARLRVSEIHEYQARIAGGPWLTTWVRP